jgi:hypothetical protein
MSSGASQPVEERIKGMDKFGLAGDRWHYRSDHRPEAQSGEGQRLSRPSFGSASCYPLFQRALQRGRTLRPNHPWKQVRDSVSKSQILRIISPFQRLPSLSSTGAEKILLKKKEIELKTDKNGIAEFPKVTADKFAVSVLVKGYKPCWRWIRTNRSEELIRMRLEKWASTPK